MKKKLRIVYMGTPEFAVEPLRVILESGFDVAAIVTTPDKPAGRGQKLKYSPVKDFALNNNLKVLQPVSLKDPEFLKELKEFGANMQVVVAFRMLPEAVWQMPEYGTINLHASLLPQYRGAAPINHAIINGETETGLTTFFIEKEIDTGNIILSHQYPILASDDAGALHDRLMHEGGPMLVETLKRIKSGSIIATSQSGLINSSDILKPAPKIFKQDCKINWATTCEKIHNLIRGLSPAPGAYTIFRANDNQLKQVKIFSSTFNQSNCEYPPGTILTDNKEFLSVAVHDGIITILEIQVEGKKRMKTLELLRGMSFPTGSKFE
jgi:methionyl-tRNA formyltransferase